MLEELKTNGYCVIKGYGNIDKLTALKNNFEVLLQERRNIKSQDSHFVMIDQPYRSCEPSLDLALDPFILDLAKQYLGTDVYLGTCNLRRSFVTKQPPTSTNLFHMDGNCGKGVRLIKAFYYLNDVDEEGGPFEYIKGSHLDRIPGWNTKIRWSDEEIYGIFGIDKSVKLTAEFGDLIIADTTGYHRGLQVKNRHRDMLTMNYVKFHELHGECVVKKGLSHPALAYAKFS